MTTPPALPDVAGRCPACNGESLMLADGGYVTCRRLECPQPDAAHEAIEERAGANAYDRAINAPMSEQAAAHLRERLTSGNIARRKVRRREQPVEHCGHETMLPVSQVSTECVLRPGHSGSHANHEGARWRLATARDACLDNPQLTAAIGYPVRCPHCATTVPPTHWTKHLQRHHPDAESQQPATGYCPHCGRGDAGPTADQYEELRQKAERAEAKASAMTAAMESTATDALRHRGCHSQLMAQCMRAERAEAALATLHEGEEPDPDPLAEPTPAQWLWRWNRATPEQRLDMAGRILQAFDEASRCIVMNHKTEAPRRQAAEQALGRVHAELDRWALNTVMPQTVRALDDIRRALEPPKGTL